MRESAPNEIWLSDLITAWKRCNASTPEARLIVASLLGFAKRDVAAAERIERIRLKSTQPQQKTVFRVTERTRRAVEVADDQLAAPLVVVQRRRTAAAGDAAAEASGPMLPHETDEHIRYEPRLEPLFEMQYQRQILYALAATLALEGEFDVDALVREISSGRVVRNALRKPVLTLRRGLQLLLDRGDGMTVFFRDQLALLTAVRRLVGPERVDVLYFAQSPTRGAGAGPKHDWTRFKTPPPRTKVIVVSDFGISMPGSLQRPSTVAEWLEFAAMVRAGECDLVGLVPYPPRRWPVAVAAVIKLVEWDRSTRFSVVRQRAVRHLEP